MIHSTATVPVNPEGEIRLTRAQAWADWNHYSAYGWADSRVATHPLFNKAYYLEHNADIKAASVDIWVRHLDPGAD